jgi:sarcosine oxidase, subunit gamma
MATSLRFSSIHHLLHSNGSWREINAMPTLAALTNDEAIAAQIGIADLSCLTRFGVKGAGAANWLEQQAISVPDRPNTWKPLSEGGIIARLGISEFLIEDSLHSSIALQLTDASQQLSAKVYPVLRQDLAIAICGVALNELLLQTCNINFHALDLAKRPVILTSMIGVAATVIPGERNGQPFYRIWCDGTFGAYVWQTLVIIAQELGGGAIGSDIILSQLAT